MIVNQLFPVAAQVKWKRAKYSAEPSSGLEDTEANICSKSSLSFLWTPGSDHANHRTASLKRTPQTRLGNNTGRAVGAPSFMQAN